MKHLDGVSMQIDGGNSHTLMTHPPHVAMHGSDHTALNGEEEESSNYVILNTS